MARYLLTAQSLDHPGVVANVSGVIAEREWSIEDASMTRLAGRFAMLMIVNVPEGVQLDEIRTFVEERLHADDVVFTVEPVGDDDDNPVSNGAPWTVTVYGSDHPGIVAAITQVIAGMSVNIDNLATRTTSGEAGQVYSMLIDVTVPPAVDANAFSSALMNAAERLGVTCHAAPVDVDVF